MSYNEKSPCRKCTTETGRYPGCHDHCDREKEYLEGMSKSIELEKENRLKDNDIRWYFSSAVKRKRRKHGRNL